MQIKTLFLTKEVLITGRILMYDKYLSLIHIYHPQQQQLYNELQTENIDLIVESKEDTVRTGKGNKMCIRDRAVTVWYFFHICPASVPQSGTRTQKVYSMDGILPRPRRIWYVPAWKAWHFP